MNLNLTDQLEQLLLQHLDKPDFAISQICGKMGYSYPHLNRIVKGETGLTLALFVRSVRVEASLELLEEADKHISEIAYEVGFASPNYFTRAFREIYGVSPREWRKQQT